MTNKTPFNQKFLRMLHGVQGGQFLQKAPPLAAGGSKDAV
jgi:hypothetical protein